MLARASVALLSVLIAASSSAQALTAWTGSASTDWFTLGNWSDGVPAHVEGSFAVIDTVAPNPTVINGGVASTTWLYVGHSGIGQLGMDLTLRGALAWRHAFGDVDPAVTLAFAGSSVFTVAGLPIAKNAALVEAGLDLAIGPGATLGLAYAGQLAEDMQDHAFKAVLAVRF